MGVTTKEEILVAALRLFSESGFAAVSMRELAKAVGITQSSIYNHFDSKEQLFKDVYTFFREEVSSGAEVKPGMVRDLVEKMDLKDLLHLIVKSYMEMYRNERATQFWRMIHQDMYRTPEAAEIILLETQRMVEASRKLFSFAGHLGKIDDQYVEAAALHFTYGIRSLLLEYDMRDRHAISPESVIPKIDTYINGFCEILNL